MSSHQVVFITFFNRFDILIIIYTPTYKKILTVIHVIYILLEKRAEKTES